MFVPYALFIISVADPTYFEWIYDMIDLKTRPSHTIVASFD